jgi:hypothetical protein
MKLDPSKKIELNSFAHKSKKSKRGPAPGPGHYYPDENTVIKDMEDGKFGPKLRKNLASKIL